MSRRLLLAVLVIAGILVGAGWAVRAEPPWYSRLVYPLRYQHIVQGHAEHYRIDPALLAGVIYAESEFDARARSEAGAIGLMQLLPSTARGIATRTGGTAFVVDDLYDPEVNVRYGAWYLRHLLDRYGDERTALAAYHAGQGNVDRWRAAGTGIGFPETRAYVERVLRFEQVYENAYADELGLD
jgi:soluble lytic murein transglycosylase